MGYRRSVPFVKAAIVARLEAIQTLSSGSTLVSYGNPSPKRWPREVVIVGAMTGWGHTHVAAMTQEREEYDIDIMRSEEHTSELQSQR